MVVVQEPYGLCPVSGAFILTLFGAWRSGGGIAQAPDGKASEEEAKALLVIHVGYGARDWPRRRREGRLGCFTARSIVPMMIEL